MFNENEVAMLLLCFGVFIFIITKRREYKRIPYWGLILASCERSSEMTQSWSSEMNPLFSSFF